MKYLTILFFVLLVASCNTKSSNKDINEIISFMIDRNAAAIPPPPHINDTILTLSKKTIDSLLKVKLKVAVYPILESFSERTIESIPKKDSGLFNLKNKPSKKVMLKGISSEKGHKIILADTVQMKINREYRDFDQLFWFSDFYFSKDKEKVLFLLGISQSGLAGESAFYILKKEKGKWQYEYSKPFQIW